MQVLKISACIFFLIISLTRAMYAQAFISVETGPVFTGYNNIRIPGDEGTLFSFKEDLPSETKAFYRLKAGYTINSRHNLFLLYAPLETNSGGMAARDIVFEGVVFPAYMPLSGSYKFNSYRLTYRYEIVKRPNIEFGMGFTAKIRDARIRITTKDRTSVKTNVGFVPIINFRLWWKLHEKFGLLLDGDALAAPQGRAEDVLLAANYMVTDHLSMFAGYRILEGGADNDEVYNFSLFHYASIGFSYIFGNQSK